MMLMKLNKNLELIWKQRYGDKHDDMAVKARQTHDGGYIFVGYTSFPADTNRKIIVAKTDNYGALQWHETLAGAYGLGEAFDVQQTSDGAYIVAGYATQPTGDEDMYFSKLSSSGAVQWCRNLGDEIKDERAYSILETETGYLIAGTVYPGDFGEQDGILLSIDNRGKWSGYSETIGGACMDRAYQVVRTANDNFVVAAMTKSFGSSKVDASWIAYNKHGRSIQNGKIAGTFLEGGSPLTATPDSGFACVMTTISREPASAIIKKIGYGESQRQYTNVLYPYSQAFTCVNDLESIGFTADVDQYWQIEQGEEAMVAVTPGGYLNIASTHTPTFHASRDTGVVLLEWNAKLPDKRWIRWRHNNKIFVSLCNEFGEKLYTLRWMPNSEQDRYCSPDLILYRGEILKDFAIVAAGWSHRPTPIGANADWVKFQMALHQDGRITVGYDAGDGDGMVVYIDEDDNSSRDFSKLEFMYKTGRAYRGNYKALIDDIYVRVFPSEN